MLQEFIEHGQRVKSFTIEAKEESAFGNTSNFVKILMVQLLVVKKLQLLTRSLQPLSK